MGRTARWFNRQTFIFLSIGIEMLRILACFICSALAIHWANAENWTHWRGPTGNGTASADSQPPTEWSDTKNVKWKAEVPGRGSSSPIIWEDKVFITTAVPTGTKSDQVPAASGRLRGNEGAQGLPELEFQVLCYHRQDGRLLWQQTAIVATPHQETHSTNGFASASACTDGEHVYAHFGSRGLYAYSLDGELKWKRNDFGQMITRNSFGEGSSPTLSGDTLLVPWDHEGDSALYALNKNTGATIWKAERDEPTCWATPLVVDAPEGKQVVMNGQNFARAYDLETGKELWRCSGQTQRPVATAVSANGIVYIGSGFQGSFLGAFRMSGRGDIRGTDNVLWTLDRDTPDIASLLLTSGRIYFHKGKSGQLSCVDAATGKPHYLASRIPGLDSIYASPIAAHGNVYLTARNGTTVVIRDADTLEVVSTNSVGETVDATPAPVDNQLFIRGERHLFCVERS
jgi:outer membrane protein assembly factor BamB